ncbi:MAG TPA: crosslink repair DNA glycosylase YcaQ family protein [Pyrinomonadaceae bacterium]
MPTTLDALRHYTVIRNFPALTSLNASLQHMGFVQADPIRAPARAQDLILRQRVEDYRAGDLELKYTSLDIEEDFFINYGYVTRTLQSLMHPRSNSLTSAFDLSRTWPAAKKKRVKSLLEFVHERGEAHPREVDERFSHGKVTNYWGGSSNASTHLLDAMHYSGMLRVARREKGIRIYKIYEQEPRSLSAAERRARIDTLVDVVVNIYAPLPASSLGYYLRRLRFAVPQWQRELKAAIERARKRLQHEVIENVTWYWPTEEVETQEVDRVRLLAPFDPLVHDRSRFELLWGWVYRFEAYTPAAKRKLGYYALPLLWRDRVIGWANLSVKEGSLQTELGFVSSQPRDRVFKRELEAELARVKFFLGL